MDEIAGKVDWPAVEPELDRRGWAVLPALLPAPLCEAVAGCMRTARGSAAAS